MSARLIVLACALVGANAMAQEGDPAEPSDPAEPGAETRIAPAPAPVPAPAPAPARPLAAPPPATTPPRASPPPAAAPPDEDEEDEDSWGVVYLQGLGGYSYVNLVAFSQDNFIPDAERISGSGFFGGLAVGFRVYWVTLGAQVTLASFPDFHLGVVGPEVALHIPIPVVQPYLRVGFGYAWMGNVDFSDPSLSETDVYGFAAEAGIGIDIKLARALSIGAGADLAFLNLTRQGLSGATSIGTVDLQEDGDSVGLQLRFHAQLTLHI